MLQRTAEYALRVLVVLAKHYPDELTSRAIARETCVPLAYTEKVLQRLAHGGLVQGHRGKSGGYRLSRPPEEIAVIDAIELFQGIVQYESCPLGLAEHAEHLCPLHERLNAAAAAVRQILGSATIKDMVESTQPASCVFPPASDASS